MLKKIGLPFLLFLFCVAFSSVVYAQDSPQFQVETDIVRVPVTVIDDDGNLYSELQQQQFRIFEDGEPQEIVNFTGGQAPLTIVLLLEHSRLIRRLIGQVVRPAGVFISQILEKGDYAAIVSYSNRPRVETDFTQNRQKLLNAITQLAKSPPGFSESSMFDAVKFVLQGGTVDEYEYKGLAEVEGRTGVLLISSGLNTLSRIGFDEARRIAANAGVPIYSLGIGEMSFVRSEPYMSGSQRLEYLQAKNRLQALSKESGGRSYSPRFTGAVDGILESVAAMLRFEYVLGYRPSPTPADERREIEVQVDLNGNGDFEDEELDLNYRRYYYPPEVED